MQEMRLYIYTDAPLIGEATVPVRYHLQFIKDDQVRASEREKESASVTSNQKGATMETMIAAITRIKDGNKVPLTVVCHCSGDFMGAINQGQYKKWSQNAWKNSKGREIEHADKWRQLYELFGKKLPKIKARPPEDDESPIMERLGAKPFVPYIQLARR